MKKNLAIAALLLTLIVSISSCKKDDNNSTTSNTLLATWKKPYQSYTVGVTLTSDNKFSFGIYSGSTYVETIKGDWAAANNKLTFSNQSGSMESCPNTPCIYNYAITGNTITLTVDTDPCSGRPDKMQGSYTK